MKLSELEGRYPSVGQNDSVERIDVKINLDEKSLAIMIGYYEAFNRVLAGFSNEPEKQQVNFSLEDWTKYVITLFYIRIKDKGYGRGEYAGMTKNIKVPALIYHILGHLGEVSSNTLDLTIRPQELTVDNEDPTLLEAKEMESISRILRRLEENYGFEMCSGIPTAEGSEEFMTMQVVNGRMATHIPKLAAVYASLASSIQIIPSQQVQIAWLEYSKRDKYVNDLIDLIGAEYA